jgi:hypothetical protein
MISRCCTNSVRETAYPLHPDFAVPDPGFIDCVGFVNPNFFRGTILGHEAENVLADLRAEENIRQSTSAAARWSKGDQVGRERWAAQDCAAPPIFSRTKLI